MRADGYSPRVTVSLECETAGLTFPGQSGQCVPKNMLTEMARRFVFVCVGLVALSPIPSQAGIADIVVFVNGKVRRYHTATIPGDMEARHLAAYARVASADRAKMTIGLTCPAYTQGLPTTACLHRSTSAVYPSICA